MRLFSMTAIVLSATMLCGCGDWTDEESARALCLFEALELKGDGAFVGNDDVSAEEQSNRFQETLTVQIQDPSTFVLEPNGTFAIDYRDIPSMQPGETFNVKCRGDFNRRIIASIEIDGQTFEPGRDESWDFGGASEDSPADDAEDEIALNVS